MGANRRKCKCGSYTQSYDGVCRVCKDGAYIPVKVVVPVIQRLLAERISEESEWTTGAQALEEETGVSARQFYDITKNRQKLISFNTVDKILSRTHNFMLWYEEPLKSFYHEPHVPRSKNPDNFCKCGTKIRPQHQQCQKCYKEEKAAAVPRCACGARLSHKRNKSCRVCLNKKRASKNAKTWASGQSWQVGLTEEEVSVTVSV